VIIAGNDSQSGVFTGKKLSEHTTGRLFNFRVVCVFEPVYNMKHHRLKMVIRGIKEE
jgi:hypothetical protein